MKSVIIINLTQYTYIVGRPDEIGIKFSPLGLIFSMRALSGKHCNTDYRQSRERFDHLVEQGCLLVPSRKFPPVKRNMRYILPKNVVEYFYRFGYDTHDLLYSETDPHPTSDGIIRISTLSHLP